MRWSFRGRTLETSRPLVVAILNLTPDSFSDGGRVRDPSQALEQALSLIDQGADILDLGGESTRPGAMPVSADEEIRRVLPVLKKIKSAVSTPVSIDTTKTDVARICLEEGADILNDVSALAVGGNDMADLVRQSGAGLVLMHRRGNAVTMQELVVYDDVVSEVCEELAGCFRQALNAGVSADQIVVDPGFGFSKNTKQNFSLLAGLEQFLSLNRPVMIGPSRKSFIGSMNGAAPAERLMGTAAAVAIGFLKGARIFRVHDVRQMREVLQVCQAIEAEGVKHVRT